MSDRNTLEGVHSHVGLMEFPEERAMVLWIRHVHHKASTSEMRQLARHILERADAVDAEANRKRRVLEELGTPKSVETPAPVVEPPKDEPPKKEAPAA